MSKTEQGRNVNAMGYGDQNKSFPDGNNTTGVLDQVRATGVVATGKKNDGLRSGTAISQATGKGRAGSKGR